MLTWLVGSAAAADPPGGCTTSAGVTTCVFAYTGAAQSWTVPEGVTSATFDLYAAQGGGNTGYDQLAAGLGGRATATIAVSSIQVNVGGQGSYNAAGFNGGGGPRPTCGVKKLGSTDGSVRVVGWLCGGRG